VGRFDGRTQGGDEADGKALPRSDEDREGHDARRVVCAHGVDPSPCAPRTDRGPRGASAAAPASEAEDLWR